MPRLSPMDEKSAFMVSSKQKIRVENLPTINVASYADVQPTPGSLRPFRILFIKPYQRTVDDTYGPPLGLLTLIACVRERFGQAATVHLWDMKLYNDAPEALATRIDEYNPDVVAVSALNCEAAASYQIARIAKAWRPEVVTVIGGPYALHQASSIFEESVFDWVFEGAADRTFLQALERQFSDQPLGEDIPGFSYRCPDGSIVHNGKQDLITDLDSIPIPAWDMADLERYRKRDRKRIVTSVGERKYAYLFTSRGCPYLCTYCHDIFTKRFVYQSDERVLEEIRILHEEHGVTELHIVDDIFNLHRPRVKSLMKAIAQRWPGKLYLAFPNGLRGDILDAETIAAMVEGGTYVVTIAIETVTPRLQELVEKHLRVEKAQWAIEEFSRHGVITRGAFMVGFPTETPEEMEATIAYAIRSSLTTCAFSSVVPQRNTPIFDLAMKESPEATLALAREEIDNGDYNSLEPWYSRAYGFDLHAKTSLAYLRFYLQPRRILRIIHHYGFMPMFQGSLFVFGRIGLTAAAWLKSTAALAIPPYHRVRRQYVTPERSGDSA